MLEKIEELYQINIFMLLIIQWFLKITILSWINIDHNQEKVSWLIDIWPLSYGLWISVYWIDGCTSYTFTTYFIVLAVIPFAAFGNFTISRIISTITPTPTGIEIPKIKARLTEEMEEEVEGN